MGKKFPRDFESLPAGRLLGAPVFVSKLSSMKKNRKNFLLEAVLKILSDSPRAKLLDAGCGDGDYAKSLKDLGFDVTAGDIDSKRFKYSGSVNFQCIDITKKLPFADNSFDYCLFLEIVEHLTNPYQVLAELHRVIKPQGFLILSTPNILNLRSRFRYLFEGSYEYFRKPILEQAKNPREVIFNLHIAPYRYHELEYLLYKTGFNASKIFSSVYEGRELSFLLPIIRLQTWLKECRSASKSGPDFRRLHKILLSKELLYGRHLIVKANKL